MKIVEVSCILMLNDDDAAAWGSVRAFRRWWCFMLMLMISDVLGSTVDLLDLSLLLFRASSLLARVGPR